jgi:hypothetical protein
MLSGEPTMPVWVPAGTGVKESHKPQAASQKLGATIVRGVLYRPKSTSTSSSPSWLLDAAGRRVLDLRAGANDVSRFAPGVYFMSSPSDRGAARVVILN